MVFTILVINVNNTRIQYVLNYLVFNNVYEVSCTVNDVR